MYVRDIAKVSDSGEEPTQYVRTARIRCRAFQPAVTLAVAERKGTNAVDVAPACLAPRGSSRSREPYPSDVKSRSRAITAKQRRKNPTKPSFSTWSSRWCQ